MVSPGFKSLSEEKLLMSGSSHSSQADPGVSLLETRKLTKSASTVMVSLLQGSVVGFPVLSVRVTCKQLVYVPPATAFAIAGPSSVLRRGVTRMLGLLENSHV